MFSMAKMDELCCFFVNVASASPSISGVLLLSLYQIQLNNVSEPVQGGPTWWVTRKESAFTLRSGVGGGLVRKIKVQQNLI